jgi:hypothetical protein
MPKLVSEIMQGRTFERTAEQGAVSDSAQRQWKIVLSSPGESFDITEAVGVAIGDVLDETNPIPCVSFSVAADGDSRMVRLVTARYATTPGEPGGDDDGGGGGGGGGGDPGSTEPDNRYAQISITTSMSEMPSWTWIATPGGGNNARVAAVNPCKEPVDGIIRLEPVVVLSVEQFETIDPTSKCQHVGKVNSNAGTYKSLNFEPRTLLFRGLTARPATEFWGSTLYRGYRSSYEFVYRRNVQKTTGGDQTICGWDMAIPQTGWNEKVAGETRRALVKIKSADGKIDEWTQSASPIALNDDGTRRDDDPLVYRRGYADAVDFSSVFSNIRFPPQ